MLAKEDENHRTPDVPCHPLLKARKSSTPVPDDRLDEVSCFFPHTSTHLTTQPFGKMSLMKGIHVLLKYFAIHRNVFIFVKIVS